MRGLVPTSRLQVVLMHTGVNEEAIAKISKGIQDCRWLHPGSLILDLLTEALVQLGQEHVIIPGCVLGMVMKVGDVC